MARRQIDPELTYWRAGDIGGACLVRAHYQSFEFDAHVHDEMVIAITEAGIGECRTRLGAELSGPGSFWVFSPGEYHCGVVEQDRHWFYRAIYLDMDALGELARLFSAENDGRALPHIPPGLYHDPALAGLMLDAHRLLEANAPALERQDVWWAAMGQLFARYGRPRPMTERSGAERARMAQARDYLAANCDRDVTIEEVARLVGLSRFHFMRSFRREYGLPPHAYANQLRLITAKRLLTAGHAPAEAAAAAGFYDQSHLNRAFKRAWGITPGAYAGLQRVS